MRCLRRNAAILPQEKSLVQVRRNVCAAESRPACARRKAGQAEAGHCADDARGVFELSDLDGPHQARRVLHRRSSIQRRTAGTGGSGLRVFHQAPRRSRDQQSAVEHDRPHGHQRPVRLATTLVDRERVAGEKNEVYLFYFDVERNIQRVEVWNTRIESKLESTEVIRTHVETLYAVSATKWLKVDELRLLPSPW
jgi:hypothetical protein